MNRGRYIKDVVYGANDGIITTFAIVVGVAGAGLDPRAVILLGVANLCADGFSMAASNFLGSSSEQDFVREEREREYEELASNPNEEQTEMIALLREQGYTADDAHTLAGLMFKNKAFFTDLMMHEEMDISSHQQERSFIPPVTTFVSFVGAGSIPLAPFFLMASNGSLFLYSIFSTSVTLFIVGALRSIVTKRSFFISGLEMLIIGGIAATIAYGIGAGLEQIIGMH